MKHSLRSLGLVACGALFAWIAGRVPAVPAEEIVIPKGPAIGVVEPKEEQRREPRPEPNVGDEDQIGENLRRVAGEIRETTKLLSLARRRVASSAEVVAAKQAIVTAEMAYADILDTKLREDPETGALLTKIAELQAKQKEFSGQVAGGPRAEPLKRQGKRDQIRDREKGMRKQVRPGK